MNALLAMMLLAVGLLLSSCAPDTREADYGHWACGWGGACDRTGPVSYGEAYGSPMPRSAPWPASRPW